MKGMRGKWMVGAKRKRTTGGGGRLDAEGPMRAGMSIGAYDDDPCTFE